MFDKYTKYLNNKSNNKISFNKWLLDNSKYITKDFDILKLESMFDISNVDVKDVEKMKINIGYVDNEVLTDILSNNGFIFV